MPRRAHAHGRIGPARARRRPASAAVVSLRASSGPASMRLEAVAPVRSARVHPRARGEQAVLLLPRDERVVRRRVGGSDSRRAHRRHAGARRPAGHPHRLRRSRRRKPSADGCTRTGGPRSISRAERRCTCSGSGAWQVRAARRDGWEVDYPAWQGMFPQAIRLRSASEPANVDMTATLSQIEVNVDVDPAAFTVDVPGECQPAEHRRAAPGRTPGREAVSVAGRRDGLASRSSLRPVIDSRAREDQSRSARARHAARRISRAAHRVPGAVAARHDRVCAARRPFRHRVRDGRRAARPVESGLARGGSLVALVAARGSRAGRSGAPAQEDSAAGRARRRQHRCRGDAGRLWRTRGACRFVPASSSTWRPRWAPMSRSSCLAARRSVLAAATRSIRWPICRVTGSCC